MKIGYTDEEIVKEFERLLTKFYSRNIEGDLFEKEFGDLWKYVASTHTEKELFALRKTADEIAYNNIFNKAKKLGD